VLAATAITVLALAAAVVGCVSSTGSVVGASGVQVCAECSGKGMPAKVEGAATVVDGVQVVDVAIVNGTYAPNVITARAGMPIRVVFTGKAEKCLAKPTFKSLGKNGDVTGTGRATIDLGSLAPGVYEFTCSMGMNAGTITVE
jgi:plastocyanin domain-containing protein